MMGDNADDINRELRGLPGSTTIRPAFDKEAIQKLKNSRYDKFMYQKHIFIGIDPACGGKKTFLYTR